MKLGIDTYSYHRLLGEQRPGEAPSPRRWRHEQVMAEMLEAGAEVLSLETAFLPPASAALGQELRAQASGREVAVSWGHPHGLRWGTDTTAARDLQAWVALAGSMGWPCVRFVLAHPALEAEGRRPDGSLRPEVRRGVERRLRTLVAGAAAHGVVLCLENHADLTVDELEDLVAAAPGLAICFDTVNALRVGDDPVDAAGRLQRHIRIVHVKDTRAVPLTCRLGDGDLDLGGVLRPLAARPDVAACVEFADLESPAADEVELVRHGVAWLARWRLTAGEAAD